MAEENAWRSDSGSSVPPSSPREDNVGDDALYVIVLHGSRRHTRPLPSRLGGGEGSIELPHGPGHVVPGNA